MAIKHGVEIIYVSNHGGRQLDFGVGGLNVLPEIVEVVENKAKIIFDGGIMRGTDVLKAIALGQIVLVSEGFKGLQQLLEDQKLFFECLNY